MKSRIAITLAFIAAAGFTAGCAGPRPLKPGAATIRSSAAQLGAAFASELKQPENPAHAAAQNFERVTETELPLPRGSTVEEKVAALDERKPDAPPVITTRTVVLSEPVTQKTRTVEKAGTSIGAAQKDTARELSARLASLKSVVWVGVALFVFGLATLVYPPLRALIGSVTTSLAMAAGGISLIILPTLVAGHELLLLAGVGIGIGAWFIAHRHGELRARAASTKR
jgi:hypothetical protein